MARKRKKKPNLPRVPVVGMNLGDRIMGDRRTRRLRTRGAQKLQLRKEFEREGD